MRVPLSWLGEFTPLAVDPADERAVRALAEVMNGLGLVVEGIEQVPSGPEGVVLARVLSIEPIAGLDRVRMTTVDAGDGVPLEVACGAWNFAVGDVVPLATIGTRLPDGRVIGRRTMRGAVSNGMLCSPVEVGVSDDADGLLVLASTGSAEAPLPPGLPLGLALNDYLGLVPDAVLDLAIEANRPDCLCMAGIARDVAGKLGLPFALPEPVLVESDVPAGSLASVGVEDASLCPELTGRVLTGIEVVPSAPRVSRWLRLAGQRPINSVVDASNFVMLELGQPTHPYDLDRLAGSRIVARAARPGEELLTLDGETRRLGLARDALGREHELRECVIADGDDRPVGLAGVMGGEASGITAATTRVLLEAALFDSWAVGRAASSRGMRTDASLRFWRGVDTDGVARASARVCELVVQAAQLAGVQEPAVARGLLLAPDPLQLPARRRISLRTGRVNAVLGTALDPEDVAAVLARIGFVTTTAPAPPGGPAGAGSGVEPAPADEAGGTVLEVTVPGFRPDVSREVDLIEEVARQHGYEHVVPTPRRAPTIGRRTPVQRERRELRSLCSDLGAHEAWTLSVVDPADQAHVSDPSVLVELSNPMASEESVLRAHLLPGLLAALRYNADRRNPSLRLFEVGRVFRSPPLGDDPGAAAGPPEQGAAEKLLPVERELVGLLLAGEDDDAATAVNAWRAVCEKLLLEPVGTTLVQPRDPGDWLAAGLHPTRSASIALSAPVAAAGSVGAVGEVDPGLLERFGLGGERRVGWLVLDLGALLELPRRSPAAPVVSPYPTSDVDLAFTLADEVPAARLQQLLAAAAGASCEWVRLVDVYRGTPVPPGMRSLAYRLRFGAPDHTLTDAELGELRERCIASAARSLGAVLRG